ncbi:MAG: hypothetical protein IT458_20895 [Planctomycetes bacterium]|nr:hypothetical protein [Planctomycetota bacterium]
MTGTLPFFLEWLGTVLPKLCRPAHDVSDLPAFIKSAARIRTIVFTTPPNGWQFASDLVGTCFALYVASFGVCLVFLVTVLRIQLGSCPFVGLAARHLVFAVGLLSMFPITMWCCQFELGLVTHQTASYDQGALAVLFLVVSGILGVVAGSTATALHRFARLIGSAALPLVTLVTGWSVDPLSLHAVFGSGLTWAGFLLLLATSQSLLLAFVTSLR